MKEKLGLVGLVLASILSLSDARADTETLPAEMYNALFPVLSHSYGHNTVSEQPQDCVEGIFAKCTSLSDDERSVAKYAIGGVGALFGTILLISGGCVLYQHHRRKNS